MIKNENFTELLTRGVEEIIDRENLEARFNSGKKLRVKLGIDPTGAKLHLGHAVTLRKLKALQDLGHKIVLIIGDFTGLIGDTSDKEAERPMLSEEQIKENMKDYLEQIGKILNVKKVEIHYNSEWLGPLGYLEIAKQADRFGLHEFIARDNIDRRIKAGKRVSLREVLYPLMQGYDSVAAKADLEIGAIEQKFNLLAGRNLQKYYHQNPQDIIIVKILPGTDGRKMSKSWGNTINIIDEPSDMFGKVMSVGDDLIIQYFELATQVPLTDINKIEGELKAGNPKDIKMRLAKEIVSLYYGDKVSRKAQEEFERVFSKGQAPENIREWRLEKGRAGIIDVLTESGTVISRAEAKRLIKQRGIKINSVPVKDWNQKVKEGDIIKAGSRKFLKIAS